LGEGAVVEGVVVAAVFELFADAAADEEHLVVWLDGQVMLIE
jgi:hypothetical protein